MDIIRFITAGNIDDGKSTLIGRILYESGQMCRDVLQSVEDSNTSLFGSGINLAFITDGLRSERELGITIDVAYKYFTTPTRKFIVTDAPGHFQYTRNLLSGASEVDVMVVLIDAQNGITDQTKRHSFIASWLNIPNVLVAVNKMDIVDYDETVFEEISAQFMELRSGLRFSRIDFMPVSALFGENINSVSKKMKWYKGPTLMDYLNGIQARRPIENNTRVSIQYAPWEGKQKNQAGCAGRVLSGTLRRGDEVTIFPGGHRDSVLQLFTPNGETQHVSAGDNIWITLKGDNKIKRGSLIVYSLAEGQPLHLKTFVASICWLDANFTLDIGKDYTLRLHAFETTCRVSKFISKLNINNFRPYSDDKMPSMNEFAQVELTTQEPVFFDFVPAPPETSRGILIDPYTNSTCAAFKAEFFSKDQ